MLISALRFYMSGKGLTRLSARDTRQARLIPPLALRASTFGIYVPPHTLLLPLSQTHPANIRAHLPV